MTTPAPASAPARAYGRWLRLGLLTLYIVACGLIAAVYISLASVRIPHEVKLLGSAVALPDQPIALYARLDVIQPADVTLRLQHPQQPTSTASHVFNIHGILRDEQPLRLPPAAAPSLTWHVTIDAPNSWIRDLPLTLSPAAPSPQSVADDGVRAAPAPAHPLSVTWEADGGKLIAFLPNTLHVRVADPTSGAPIAGARVRFQRAYGAATTTSTPDLPPTDAFGLTSLDLSAEASSVWDVEATDPDGQRATTLKRELHTFPATPRVTLLTDALYPGLPLSLAIDSLRSGPCYIDLWLHGAFVYRWPLHKPEGPLSATLPTDALAPLTTPALATLVVTWSPDSYGEDVVALPLLWSGAPPPDGADPALGPGLLALLDDVAARHPSPFDAAFASRAAATLRARGVDRFPTATLRRLLSTARALWAASTPAPALALVFDSVPHTDAALRDLRDSVKGKLNVPFALLLIGGALLLATALLRMSMRQRAAFAAELADAPDDLAASLSDPNDPTAAAAATARWVWRLEVALVALILAAFIWGILLGLQHL
jgi:hypothetical protein